VRRIASISVTMAVAAGCLMGVVPDAQATTLPTSLTVVGHGWGHGLGMGQYGALGYASAPFDWSYRQILSHYYGGTVMSTVSPTEPIDVHLDELDGASEVTVATPPGDQLWRNGRPIPSPSTVSRTSSDQTITATRGPSAVDVVVSGPWSSGSQRSFAGAIVLKANVAQVWNVLPLDQYVEGVVPREAPASWPLATLEAQAVAARSYALAVLASSPPAICDNTSCQVYGGDPSQYPVSDNANSDAAVTSTAGQILEWGSDTPAGYRSNAPALTEYSSSTGGYTAGGDFPAVVDQGDATPSNPNHSWIQQVPTSAVQAAYGSAVGRLEGVVVTQRNGLGDLGGRVTQMVLTGSAGRITITGDQFAWAVGLRSDWFAVTNAGGSSGGVNGYWIVAGNGGIYPFGVAVNYGSMTGRPLNAPVIGMAPTADSAGYWLVAGDGGIFSFGDARFYGSTGDLRLNQPVIGMASSYDGKGYWLYASDGGIFSFGDARFYGSTGGIRLNQPVVGMATTPDGKGYWLVAADGGIFSFGDAHFYGSTGNVHLAQPIVGMVATANGGGYWLVGRDGGIFTFGNAGFVGSLPGEGISDTIVSVAATADGGGYLMVSSGGLVYAFGDAPYFGDPASTVAGWSSHALGVFAHKV
jgi:SpoIID/LytB domain protein